MRLRDMTPGQDTAPDGRDAASLRRHAIAARFAWRYYFLYFAMSMA